MADNENPSSNSLETFSNASGKQKNSYHPIGLGCTAVFATQGAIPCVYLAFSAGKSLTHQNGVAGAASGVSTLNTLFFSTLPTYHTLESAVTPSTWKRPQLDEGVVTVISVGLAGATGITNLYFGLSEAEKYRHGSWLGRVGYELRFMSAPAQVLVPLLSNLFFLRNVWPSAKLSYKTMRVFEIRNADFKIRVLALNLKYKRDSDLHDEIKNILKTNKTLNEKIKKLCVLYDSKKDTLDDFHESYATSGYKFLLKQLYLLLSGAPVSIFSALSMREVGKKAGEFLFHSSGAGVSIGWAAFFCQSIVNLCVSAEIDGAMYNQIYSDGFSKSVKQLFISSEEKNCWGKYKPTLSTLFGVIESLVPMLVQAFVNSRHTGGSGEAMKILSVIAGLILMFKQSLYGFRQVVYQNPYKPELDALDDIRKEMGRSPSSQTVENQDKGLTDVTGETKKISATDHTDYHSLEEGGGPNPDSRNLSPSSLLPSCFKCCFWNSANNGGSAHQNSSCGLM